jgi:hypothetical protein
MTKPDFTPAAHHQVVFDFEAAQRAAVAIVRDAEALAVFDARLETMKTTLAEVEAEEGVTEAKTDL